MQANPVTVLQICINETPKVICTATPKHNCCSAVLVDEYSDESVVSVADLAIGTSAPVWIITMVQRGGVSKE